MGQLAPHKGYTKGQVGIILVGPESQIEQNLSAQQNSTDETPSDTKGRMQQALQVGGEASPKKRTQQASYTATPSLSNLVPCSPLQKRKIAPETSVRPSRALSLCEEASSPLCTLHNCVAAVQDGTE